MAKRRLGIIALLLCFCFCIVCHAQAMSTSDASEFISPNRVCELNLTYSYDGKAFPDMTVNLYRVAEISADFRYTLTYIKL